MTMDKITYAKHASEGGHWYAEDGRLVESVLSADGKKQVSPDLRHARKLNLAPGVTTICGLAYRHDLVLWKQRQAIQAALTLPRKPNEDEASWLQRVEFDMGETARKAADEGTAVHAALQSALERRPFDDRHAGRVLAALDAIKPLGESWTAERPCISPYGYGTKADLVCSTYYLDTKTKDGDLANVSTTYSSHWMQLAATRQALGMTVPAGILYVSRTHDAARVVPVTEERLDKGWRMFCALLRFWQAERDYRPAWAIPTP